MAKDNRKPMTRWFVVQLAPLGQGHGMSLYLDVKGLMDTRASAVSYAEREGGFVVAADWWPKPGDDED